VEREGRAHAVVEMLEVVLVEDVEVGRGAGCPKASMKR